MKIVYISRSTFPSSSANSVNVIKMCEAFSQLGHEVILIGNLKAHNLSEIFSFYGVKHPFKVEHSPSLDGSNTDFLYFINALWKLLRIKPHMVYGRFLELCSFTSLLGIPTIYEAHKPLKGYGKRLFFQVMINAGNLIKLVFISEGLARHFEKTTFLTSKSKRRWKTCVAHDGASECTESIEPTWGNTACFPREGFLNVGYIGSLYPGKGMEIISELVALCPWAFFHIVGGTPSNVASWQLRCSKNGKTPRNIRFYGHVPHGDTVLFRSVFDVAMLPLLPKIQNVSGNLDESWYVSPLKLFEYMASGLPILASNTGSIKEIIVSGENGILLPPDDIPAWRDALLFLRDHPQERKRLGANARECFRENFSWLSRAKKVLNLPQSHSKRLLLRKGGKGAPLITG